uniref:C2 domain-containing protein n=1 Tax=Hyaloperonospora arabidopsidis (strain Emoy2) TaxID=559515 RepID=M4BVF8_HYAAE
MSSPTEFQRVKNLWQTRVGREVPPAVQEVAIPSRESPVDNQVTDSQTPHTPDCHGCTMEETEQEIEIDDATPVSPVSTSSTLDSTDSPSTESPVSTSSDSPPSSPVKSPSKSVASMFRTFSDACMFPSIKSRRPAAPTSAPPSALASALAPVSVPSTLRSFAPPMPITWRGARSVSDCAVPSTRSTFPFASVTSTSSLLPREAAENAINNVFNVGSRPRPAAANPIFRGSPYGELVLVDILETRGLAVNQDAVELPVVVTMQLSHMSRKTIPSSGRDDCTVNERFVFWLPSSLTNDQRTFDVFVHERDGRDLGEVHFSLTMPLNETFTDSYPLVNRSDGLKHGSIQVAMRRLVLTSSPMLETAKALSAREGCLSLSESNDYGDALPELWTCFPGTDLDLNSTCNSKDVDISRKLGRLIGFQDAAQRDIF